MTPERFEAVRQRLLENRRRQGLPDHITDATVLAQVARILRGGDRRAQGVREEGLGPER